MHLIAEIGSRRPPIYIKSYEAEGPEPILSIGCDVLALHETYIDVINQLARFSRLGVGGGSCASKVGNADLAIEVCDRR